MKSLQIIESCLVSGEHTEAGTILKNVDNAVAADLIVNGRAVEILPAESVEHRDPEPEHRDPKPGKKAKAAPASE